MDVDAVVAAVAAATGLAEGPSGVQDVLTAISRSEPAAVREVSRLAELPVPIVAAVCNELRARGVVDKTRPVRLTEAGRRALGPAQPQLTAACPACDGRGLAVPPELTGLAGRLEAAAAGAPTARTELDQTHCTVPTKIHRVLRMHEAGALAGRRILLLGDDDLIAVAVAWFWAGTGLRMPRLTVLDTDPDVLGWIREQAAGSGLDPELVEHDLRDPLPPGLAGRFEVACTDPPYTVAGAELFLSRAVTALAAGPGRHVFFSFGARRPEETLRTQQAIAGLGLAVRGLWPGFNSYVGAGILGGTSNLYHLRTAAEARPLITGPHAGPLYTAEQRGGASRPYRCAGCRAVLPVGPGARWPQIADLRAARCPECGGTVFRPMARSAPVRGAPGPAVPAGTAGNTGSAAGTGPAAGTGAAAETGPAAGAGSAVRTEALPGTGAAAQYVIRAAAEADLDAIAGYEIDIARVSFGAEAVTDPALHRKRAAGALGKPGEITLIAAAASAPDVPLGWAWLSARTNSLTGERYGNFRSLAVSDVPGRSALGELLLGAVLEAADAAGLSRLAGKVHARNLGMRTLYRKFGFEAAHLTMERPGPDAAPQTGTAPASPGRGPAS
ncbi:MAG: GNAT family N-acetyltransferase [Streptosporangiaceae bacterium]